ncbi:sigma-54 interaction domain-containing protein [Anaerosinus massiliensis]|uniref:sigma-54 interaction domain-containing protein n=1 Tax=Massilibacillus massiliensis TaxID=1806837 RepID=UPI000DA6324C|nr:sigma 54-interacting transcriptional regulator [Massilibacillus massiliensis]
MRNLVVVAMGQNTSIAFREQLYRLLGNRVNVNNYYIENGLIPTNIKADLVLFSSQHAYRRAKIYVNKTCPILIARRSINYHEVNKLFEIPAGTDVLLVNDLASSANQTIALLQTLGIDHINYYPYSPQSLHYPKLKIAITPGEKELVPDFVEEVIDIKTRLIDITTLVEVLLQLNLLNVYANFLSANYVRDIIRLIKNDSQMIYFSNKIKTQFETVIDTVHDGIIAIDGSGKISVLNPVAEKLFDIKAEQAIGHSVYQITNTNLIEVLDEKNQTKESLVTINRHHLIVNVAYMQPENPDFGRIYTFKDVSEIRRLEESVRRKFVQEQKVARYTFSQVIGQSKAIEQVLEIAQKMAVSNSTILIQGESGTGKELIAQGIHNASPRSNGPFIAVNFAALTENLLESELFGYIEGAFTGANRGGAAGLFEEAHKGTIFLDEIGDAPLTFQVKLLRVLQEQQIRRVGSSKLIPIDVRVIVATNRDLKKLIADGQFRQDLYYRLNVLPIKLPPLRERGQDILLLAKAFYQNNSSRKNGVDVADYFKNITTCFLSYSWPGNIRELQNVVEYLMNLCPDMAPMLEHLPDEFQLSHQAKNFAMEDETTLMQKIYEEIYQSNQQDISIGRRSLSERLAIPENQVRYLLKKMQENHQIVLQRGRKGIRVKSV